ncbi:MAG: DNA gyrase C-terminal beta-propeller domain-containing protein, partial [Pirellulaceae bacterium]|nr:DNA gyrase C-terminal beta-propeller domain-containing protein [Pirellulaceae bacterium]
YRTQRRGGKGLRDIKTTARNGKVIGITRVEDDNEVMMMTARGKIQRIAVKEIGIIGRNTQGVRIMSLDGGDKLAAVVRVPLEEGDDDSSTDAVGVETPTTEPNTPVDTSPPTETPHDSEIDLSDDATDD